MNWKIVTSLETSARLADVMFRHAPAAIEWCLQQRTAAAIDMAFKWLDVFGDSIAHKDRLLVELQRALREVVGVNRSREWTYDGDLDIEVDPTRRRPQARCVAIVASPGSAKAREVVDRLLQAGVPRQQVSFIEVDDHYPSRAYGTATSAWYPPSETGIRPSMPSEYPVETMRLADLPTRVDAEDTLVVILGMPRIAADMINTFPCGIINAHNGLLPYFRGLDSPAWAYMHGAKLGYTLHYIDQELDVGTLISRKALSSPSKSAFDDGMVRDLVTCVATVLGGASLAERAVQGGPYFYRTSLETRGVLNSLFLS